MEELLNNQKKNLSTKKKLLFNAIIIFTPIIIAFALAEEYIRLSQQEVDLWAVTGRIVSQNPMIDWAFVDAFSAFRARPGHYGKSKKINKTVNNYGFISTPDLSVEKPTNIIRIAFLGGSSTAGTGSNLNDEDTWPFKVKENLISKIKTKKIEYINAALPGYTTFESFGRLWSRIRFFSPDIIVVYHGWNEMYYFNKGNKIVNWRTNSDGSWGFQQIHKLSIYEPYLIDHLIRHSQLLTKVRLYFSKPKTGEVGPEIVKNKLETYYDKTGLDVFRTNIRLLRDVATVINSKLFVAKQATLIVPNLAEKDRKRCGYGKHGFDHNAHVDAFNQIYGIIDEEIDSENIIDVTELSGISDYFTDHIHPTKLGSTKIANIVAMSLQSEITALDN